MLELSAWPDIRRQEGGREGVKDSSRQMLDGCHLLIQACDIDGAELWYAEVCQVLSERFHIHFKLYSGVRQLLLFTSQHMLH